MTTAGTAFDYVIMFDRMCYSGEKLIPVYMPGVKAELRISMLSIQSDLT